MVGAKRSLINGCPIDREAERSHGPYTEQNKARFNQQTANKPTGPFPIIRINSGGWPACHMHASLLSPPNTTALLIGQFPHYAPLIDQNSPVFDCLGNN